MSGALKLGSAAATDIAISRDGLTVYTTSKDGVLRAYDMRTGALANSWDIGTNLGAIDMSPDGSFLMIVEREPLGFVDGPLGGKAATLATYKFDISNESSTTYSFSSGNVDQRLIDIAVTSSGKVVVSKYQSGTGWGSLVFLDAKSGVYVEDDVTRGYATLSPSEDGSNVLIVQGSRTPSSLELYSATSGGIVAGNFAEPSSGV